MNSKSTFHRNFDSAILELTGLELDQIEQLNFMLVPVEENKGKETSKDDWMKYAVLKNNSIQEEKPYSEAIRLMSGGSKHYPLWAKLSLIHDGLIQIEFSTRFRHMNEIRNNGSKFPPFEL